MTAECLPQFVVLPSEDVDDLVATMELIAGVLPEAVVHVVRPGFPAIDAVADLAESSGLVALDVPAAHGFDAVLAMLDACFGTQPWCWFFAGERPTASALHAIADGCQAASAAQLGWLETPSPLAAGRVRAGGAELAVGDPVAIDAHVPRGSWRVGLLAGVRPAFASFDEVADDVALLAHLGELDAAYQRAELAWSSARDAGAEDAALRLARASVMLALVLGISTASQSACAYWLEREPVPFVAVAYADLAEGSIPYPLVERLLDLAPPFTPIGYRDGAAAWSVEHVERLRMRVVGARRLAQARWDGLLRLATAGHATSSEFGAGLVVAYALGIDPAPLLDLLPAEPELRLAECVNVNIEADVVARTIAHLRRRHAGQAWLVNLVERFVLARNVEAALALDRAGVAGRHWSRVASLAWVAVEARTAALVRAVVHGELDAADACARADELGTRSVLDEALEQEGACAA